MCWRRHNAYISIKSIRRQRSLNIRWKRRQRGRWDRYKRIISNYGTVDGTTNYTRFTMVTRYLGTRYRKRFTALPDALTWWPGGKLPSVHDQISTYSNIDMDLLVSNDWLQYQIYWLEGLNRNRRILHSSNSYNRIRDKSREIFRWVDLRPSYSIEGMDSSKHFQRILLRKARIMNDGAFYYCSQSYLSFLIQEKEQRLLNLGKMKDHDTVSALSFILLWTKNLAPKAKKLTLPLFPRSFRGHEYWTCPSVYSYPFQERN